MKAITILIVIIISDSYVHAINVLYNKVDKQLEQIYDEMYR